MSLRTSARCRRNWGESFAHWTVEAERDGVAAGQEPAGFGPAPPPDQLRFQTPPSCQTWGIRRGQYPALHLTSALAKHCRLRDGDPAARFERHPATSLSDEEPLPPPDASQARYRPRYRSS